MTENCREDLKKAGIAGPWDDEPDREEWRHLGLACLARRNSMGGWCGYVAIPEGHPLHGNIKRAEEELHAHGGITYAKVGCHGEICHVPQPGESDNPMWVGFDCAHYDDVLPAMLAMPYRHSRDGSYWYLVSVKAMVQGLAKQVAETSA